MSAYIACVEDGLAFKKEAFFYRRNSALRFITDLLLESGMDEMEAYACGREIDKHGYTHPLDGWTASLVEVPA